MHTIKTYASDISAKKCLVNSYYFENFTASFCLILAKNMRKRPESLSRTFTHITYDFLHDIICYLFGQWICLLSIKMGEAVPDDAQHFSFPKNLAAKK